MAPRVDQVQSTSALPKRTEVVIVGGGIVGASLALELAERGIPVVLCEKGEVGAEQSSRNLGWVRKMGRDVREVPLAMEALRLWPELEARTGRSVGFVRSGIAYLCETQKELDKVADWVDIARTHGLDTRVLTGAEVNNVMPQTTRKWAGALYTASDGRAEPEKAAPAIANAAVSKGAIVLTYCAVRTIETAAGRVSGVMTEHGPIECSTVVLAGGAWSGLFCRNLGVDFPQLKITATVVRTAPIENGPEVSCSGPGFVLRRRLDGGYSIGRHPGEIYDLVPDSFRFISSFQRIGKAHFGRLRPRLGKRWIEEWNYPSRWTGDQHTPFEETRTINPKPHAKAIRDITQMMGAYFPSMSDFKVVQSWVGMVDVTPDALPVIAPIDTLPGFFLASGFSGTGFAMGPAAGRLAADLVTGSTPIVDPTPFKLDRLRSLRSLPKDIAVGGTP